MALLLDVVSSTGLEVKDSYYKITEYTCDKENNISARLFAYVSGELCKSGASAIEGTEILIKLEGKYEDSSVNTKKQIYEKVKSMKGFEKSKDV